MRILIADDVSDIRDSLSMLLQMEGHEVHIARDGEQALELADTLTPPVILLDIGMPKINGFNVCKIIRQLPWGKAATIIAITGWATEADRQRSIAAGFDAHFAKPVDPEALRALITSKA